MAKPSILLAAGLWLAPAVTAQVRVVPFVGIGAVGLRSVQHGYQDVSQFGWVSAVGLTGGFVVQGAGRFGVEVTVDHARSGKTAVYGADLLPTGALETTAETVGASVTALVGHPGAPLRWRVGLSATRHDGAAALRSADRIGLRAGFLVAGPRLGFVRPAIDLAVTRHLSTGPGYAWSVAPTLRLSF